MAQKFDILNQRFSVDMKAGRDERNRSFYEVDFELKEHVTVGSIKLFRDNLQTVGIPIYQEEEPHLYNTIEQVLEERFVK